MKTLLSSMVLVSVLSFGAPAAWSMDDVPAPKPAGVAPGDSKPAENKPAEAKPLDGQPAETKPAEAQPTEAKPADASAAASAQAKKGPIPAIPLDPERFSFMTGRWVSSGGSTEEHWTSVRGDGMVGMFRTQGRNNRTNFLELMSIITDPYPDEQGRAIIRFRMRHFERTVEPWKAEPQALELLYNAAASSNTKAVFEAEAGADRAGSLSAVHYEANGAEGLKITLKFAAKLNPPEPPKQRPDMVFELKREGTAEGTAEGKKAQSHEGTKGE